MKFSMNIGKLAMVFQSFYQSSNAAHASYTALFKRMQYRYLPSRFRNSQVDKLSLDGSKYLFRTKTTNNNCKKRGRRTKKIIEYKMRLYSEKKLTTRRKTYSQCEMDVA